MGSFNLSAFLVVFLVVLWVAHALPRIAERRRVMGDAENEVRASMPTLSRSITPTLPSARRSSEVTSPMSDSRPLLHPADPTARPRFSDTPGERVDTLKEERGRVWMLRIVFALTLAATAALTLATIAGLTPWWAAGAAGLVLGVYIVSLRRAELHRRARVAQAKRRDEETRRIRTGETPAVATANAAAGSMVAEAEVPAVEVAQERAAAQVAAPGSWTPRPVPVPAYALRGNAEDMATRHAAHRAAMGSMPFEAADLEEREAYEEQEFPAAMDLDLDTVLERRRSA